MTVGRFIRDDELPALAACDATRLTPLLVRCHEGRFTTPAQNAAALIAVVEAAGWTVRDVCIVGEAGP